MKKRNPILVFFWVAGLIILVQIVFSIGLYVPFWVATPETSNFLDHIFSRTEFSLFIGAYCTLVCIPVTYLITKFLWRRDFEWIGLSHNGIFFINGLGAGMTLPVIIILIIAIFSPVDIQLNLEYSIFEIGSSILGIMGMMLFVGFEEEILFRGMLTREWATTRLKWLYATLMAGLIFGTIHIINMPSVTFIMSMKIIISGLIISSLFVAIYVRYHSLWPAIGFHVGWNFIISAVLGTPVSGFVFSRSIFVIDLTGPSLITGDKFGIEASIVTNIVIIIIIILLLRYPFNKKVDLMSSEIK